MLLPFRRGSVNNSLTEKKVTDVRRLVSALREGRLLSGTRRHVSYFIHIWRERWFRHVLDLRRYSEPPFPVICYHGIADTDEARVLKSCFAIAVSKASPLPAEISGIRGMSGQKYRSFIHHLVASTPHPRYLEIGSWAGSTAAAALYRNRVHAVCIDNWSQFGGPSSEFFENLDKVLSKEIEFKFLEKDFRSVDYSQLGNTFNIYMFDGPHKEDDQYDGLVLAQAALDNCYFLIVDDWNWIQVRLGTLRALRDLKCKLVYGIESTNHA